MIRGLILALALATPAGAIDLALPADCTLGDTCYIQQYFDHDPGPGAQDFTCGGLSYDGHDGTDIALPSRAAMAAGVAVLAAAAGTVTGTRDGLADFAPVVPGKECGNGVIIDHGQGWQTQYCHMKQGSITVHPGDSVTSGTPLGRIGQTGLADFPQLHPTLCHEIRTILAQQSNWIAGSEVGKETWRNVIRASCTGVMRRQSDNNSAVPRVP